MSLSYRHGLSMAVAVGRRPYELQPIRIPMRLDELINISICHPLGYHCELGVTHRDSQQWQYIWMAEGIPGHNLLTESLHVLASAPGQHTQFQRD